MSHSISVENLLSLSGTERWPIVVGATRCAKFEAEGRRIAGSVWRDHLQTAVWGPHLARSGKPLVIYCLHGHNVSQLAVARLRAMGINALYLDGGIDAWEAAGGVSLKRHGPGVPLLLPEPTEWVTRARPKIDRIACPWLIRRFIDPFAVFHYVDAAWVKDIADEMGGIAYDIDGVHYSHRGELCSFDVLLDEFGIDDPALRNLALIVRGADTARLDLAPQAAGLLAISLGLSAIEADDHVQLEKGMAIYDALYGWCRHASGETHNWPSAKQGAAS